MGDTTPGGATEDLHIPKLIPGFRTSCRVFMHLFSNYTVTGRHNIPREGAYILINNHHSYFDATAMGGAIIHQIAGYAARKYKKSLLRPIFEAGAPVSIEQDSPDRKALMQAIKILKSGHPFVIAPEGTRSKTGGLLQGKEGVAFIATRTNVPILPAAIWGSEYVMRRPRPKVFVTFGKPFRLPEGRAKGDLLHDYTERMMCAIAALMPQAYHGFYAGNPVIEEMAALVRE